jgi:hypothetical protein
MGARERVLLILIPLGIVDAVIPLPIVGLVLFYVVLTTPPWFLALVRDIYGVR